MNRREICQVPSARGGVYYRVARGDTLHSIAVRSGCPVETIRSANGLRGDAIRPGKHLWLPGGKPVNCNCRPTPSGAIVCEPKPEPFRPQGGYRIVARNDWGARPLRSNHDPMNGVQRITLHHTDEVPGLTARGDRDVVAAIQHYLQDTMGGADIGYHYLIGRDGLVYEGRSATAQGAHSGGANNIQNLGIAMIGNFSGRLPNRAQMNALERFLSDQRSQNRVAGAQVFGHRDLGPTECPGTTLYGWLDTYRRA